MTASGAARDPLLGTLGLTSPALPLAGRQGGTLECQASCERTQRQTLHNPFDSPLVTLANPLHRTDMSWPWHVTSVPLTSHHSSLAWTRRACSSFCVQTASFPRSPLLQTKCHPEAFTKQLSPRGATREPVEPSNRQPVPHTPGQHSGLLPQGSQQGCIPETAQ